MDEGDKIPPSFKAVDVYFKDESLVFVSPDEAEAQRACCEAHSSIIKSGWMATN